MFGAFLDSISLEALLRDICANGSRLRTEVSVNMPDQISDSPSEFTLWIDQVHAQAKLDIGEAAERCGLFLRGEGPLNGPLTLVFSCPSKEKDRINRTNFILILEGHSSVSKKTAAKSFFSSLPWASWIPAPKYQRLEAHLDDVQGRPTRSVGTICAFLALSALVLIALFSVRTPTAKKWPEDGYIRYPTPNSDGPKRQVRIYYNNATEWSRNNPHNNGEWRIRMDDQALIPAELYDDDEDRYQQWFIARYPEINEVIESRNYIRPSWLGSLDIQVLWDNEFHLAHCVLAFRRYWKAKESGTHVCSRDIDYNHIKHCLDRFDEYAFPPGPRTKYEQPIHLWWQTKVCF